jgi:hypothetical protein
MSWRDELAFWGVEVPETLSVDQWAASLRANPCRNTLLLVALSTLLFHRAEKGRNPKVQDIWDALVYCSTCISVGYGDIFARTPFGKLLGSALMTIGPALAAKTIDGPERNHTANIHHEILATLRQILNALQHGVSPG